MITENLKATNLFIYNEYFDKYIQLIQANLKTKRQTFKTQRHHIIPAVAFNLYNWPGKDDESNLVNLLYKDHILAHYYLALCSKTPEFQYKMVCAINFILGKATQTKLNIEELKTFTLNLEEYQRLYEESKKYISNLLKGTTHDTSDETKEKISKANKGKIYVNKDGTVRSIQPEDLDLFLESGWVRGNPNARNRNTCKGYTIVNKDNIEKYISKEELDEYLNDGWQQGRANNHIAATKNGTQAYYDKLTKEEKIKKCATRTGQHWQMSDECKEKIRQANLGKKGSEQQKLKNSLNKKNTIHMTNGSINRMIKPELEQELAAQGFWRGRTLNKNK